MAQAPEETIMKALRKTEQAEKMLLDRDRRISGQRVEPADFAGLSIDGQLIFEAVDFIQGRVAGASLLVYVFVVGPVIALIGLWTVQRYEDRFAVEV